MVPDQKINDPPRGWILYDGSCGICRNLMHTWEATLRSAGYALAPLQADWVAPRLKMTEDELVRDVRLLLPDGTHLHGADVYRHAMQHIWWAYPLYLFSILPLGRPLFNWLYRTIASHRHIISRSCHLPFR